MFHDTLHMPLPAFSILLFLAGSAWLARHEPRSLWLLVGPLSFMAIAGALRVYPFGERLAMFLAPAFVLVIVAGTASVARWAADTGRALAGATLAAALLAPTVVPALPRLAVPYVVHDIKPAMAYIQQNRQPGDAVYIYDWARPLVRYYAPRLGIDRAVLIEGHTRDKSATGMRADLQQLRGRRVWMVFAHVCATDGVDDDKILLGEMDRLGRRVDEFHAADAGAYLYDCTAR
jgi:hypothetical protein